MDITRYTAGGLIEPKKIAGTLSTSEVDHGAGRGNTTLALPLRGCVSGAGYAASNRTPRLKNCVACALTLSGLPVVRYRDPVPAPSISGRRTR